MASVRHTLLTTKWLFEVFKTNKSPPNFRILDASWHLPNSDRVAVKEYREKHIPGALFFDIEECSDKTTSLPHMLPTADKFASYVGKLGINNSTHVLLYDNHPGFGIYSAQRVWWTFRVFGHDNVSILEGGLRKWMHDGGKVTSEILEVPEAKFVPDFKQILVKSIEDVRNFIVDDSTAILLDARPAGRFQGVSPEPRSDTKPGHIPKSVNIPFIDLMTDDKSTLKKPNELSEIFKQAGVHSESPIIVSCGSGITACTLALAASLCGWNDVAVFDGSWTQWYRDAPDNMKFNVPSD